MNKKRIIAIIIGILIILTLLIAVAYFSRVTGGVITSATILSRFSEGSTNNLEKEVRDNVQNNSG